MKGTKVDLKISRTTAVTNTCLWHDGDQEMHCSQPGVVREGFLVEMIDD